MARRVALDEILSTLVSTSSGAPARSDVPRPLVDLRRLSGFDFGRTFGPVYSGPSDPCTRRGPADLWRASRTPEGSGTLHLFARHDALWARAFGPGADWLLLHAARIASLDDRPEDFAPSCPKLRRLRPFTFGLRLAQTPTVMDALLPTIVHQRVKTYEARRSWARIVRALGEPAPGVPFVMLPPDPKTLAKAPSWWFAQHGVEQKRARTIIEVCRHARRLDGSSAAEVARLFSLIPGVGPWTHGHVRLKAFGDTDALLLGDYHLPHAITYFFTGEPRGTDAKMVELLSPFAGQRARALMWIRAAGVQAPRYGPKQRFRFAP